MTQAKTEFSTSRRALFSGAGAMTALATAGMAHAATPHPDAELIAACARYPMAALALSTEPEENGPHHTAYDRLFAIIENTSAQTMDGIVAKARAAARTVDDGNGGWNGSVGEYWAFGVVDDLLRLHDGDAA